jgi:signal peptidase I
MWGQATMRAMKRLWPVLLAFTGPGVGQALVGRRRTAIVFAASSAIAMCALGFSVYALIVFLAIHAASILDTINYVGRKRTIAIEHSLEAVIVWVAFVGCAVLVRGYVAEAFKFPSSSMAPTLGIDDHVFVSKLQSYGRGDVVVFTHPCAHRSYGKRIVALANDTVEVRCNKLFINGKAVPTELVRATDTYKDRNEDSGGWFQRDASRYRETLGGNSYEIFDRPDRARESRADAKDFPHETAPDCTASYNDTGAATKQQPGTIVDTKSPDAPCEPHRHFVVPAGHVFVLGDSRNNSNDSRFWGAVPVENIIGKVIGIWLPIRRFGSVD